MMREGSEYSWKIRNPVSIYIRIFVIALIFIFFANKNISALNRSEEYGVPELF